MQTTPQTPVKKEEPKGPPPEFQAGKIDGMGPAELGALLKDPAATTFQKAKACQRLASTGTRETVPALAALLRNPQLAHYARYGLEPLPDPAADDALREAMPKLKGRLLVGVLNSIGQRKDAKAAPALARMLYDSDAEVAQAAAAALGSISGAQAAKALTDGLRKTKAPVRTAVAGAGLVCAEGLLARGERNEALALYDTLSRTDVPKPVRLAAMRGIIATEISLTRPR